MGLGPRGYARERQSRPYSRLRLQLGQQSGVAPEARRTSGQVLCYRGFALSRVEREISKCSVRGATLACRVMKSIIKIRPVKGKVDIFLFFSDYSTLYSPSHVQVQFHI